MSSSPSNIQLATSYQETNPAGSLFSSWSRYEEAFLKAFTVAFSDKTKEVIWALRSTATQQPRCKLPTSDNLQRPEDAIREATSRAKSLISQMSMYLENTVREKVLEEIDIIHQDENWEEGDDPIDLDSVLSFLAWARLAKPTNSPGVGMSSEGHLITYWLANEDKDQLILEFQENNSVTWFVNKKGAQDGGENSGSGISDTYCVNAIINGYEQPRWLYT